MIAMDITLGVLLINGHLVSGFSDSEDCLGFPQDLELATVTKGADGKMCGSKTGEKGGEVTIKLLPNSPSAAFFAKLIKQQQLGLPIIISGSWSNPSVGEFIQMKGGILKTGPKGTTYGKGKAGEKVYVIEFETIDETPETLLLGAAVSTLTSFK